MTRSQAARRITCIDRTRRSVALKREQLRNLARELAEDGPDSDSS
jgi:hypothetical protein